MVSRSIGRGKFVPALAAVLLGCLAAPVCGDELLFLPDGCVKFTSIDLAAFLKSKMFQEVKKHAPDFEHGMNTSLTERNGIPAANVARMTFAEATFGNTVQMIATIKPISAAAIKAAYKPRPYYADFTHQEIKVGAFLVYEESYRLDDRKDDRDKNRPLQKGSAFCVVEDKLVLYGRLEQLKPLLESGRKPKLSKEFQAGLQQTGLRSTMTLLLDLQGMAAEDKQQLMRSLNNLFPGLDGVAGVLQAFTLQVSAAEDVRVSATVTCKDAVSAAAVKKVADGGLMLFKNFLNDAKNLPASVKNLRVVLDAVQISARDNHVHAEVTAQLSTAVPFFLEFDRPRKPADTTKEKFKGPRDGK